MYNSNSHSEASAGAGAVLLQHDGTVTGSLCALAWAHAHPTATISFVPPDADHGGQDLFAPVARQIPSDPDMAQSFLQQLQKAAGRGSIRSLLFALQVPAKGRDTMAIAYTRHLLLHGEAGDHDHAHPAVAGIHRLARRVSHEIHRMKGLLRFGRLRDGRFLAIYEPDHDITVPLASHFARRLRGQSWIMVDARRQCAATWDTTMLNRETDGASVLTGERLRKLLATCSPDPEDDYIQSLWRTFHAAIAIETRINPVLQRRCMPARYWKHLPEVAH